MTTLVDCPQSNWGQWNFRLFGVPVHVKIWFWLSMLMLSGGADDASVLIWVAVFFVSILLHEFGHVAAQSLFGERSEVVLYTWGGLAFGDGRARTPFSQFVISLAGPFFGFGLAGLTILVAVKSGAAVHFGFHMFLPTLSAWPKSMVGYTMSQYRWLTVLNDLLWVNFYWGLVNLLPVYPLDGGQAARAIFEQRDYFHGLRRSLIFSAIVAGGVALFALANRSIYLVIMFGVLAVYSLQSIETARPRMSGTYRSSR
jgi:membrane-associated protease RseP (regulator of RpoE activity)